MEISQELSDKIQKEIREYVANPEPFIVTGDKLQKKINLRNIAKELNFLPIVFDWFDCWGIQPTSRIIFVPFDKPFEFRVKNSENYQYGFL